MTVDNVIPDPMSRTVVQDEQSLEKKLCFFLKHQHMMVYTLVEVYSLE